MAAPSVKITRWQRDPDGDGWLLAFVCANRALFAATVATIKNLPTWQRFWLSDERAWWIHGDAVSLLMRQLPALRQLLDEQQAQFYERWQREADARQRENQERQERERQERASSGGGSRPGEDMGQGVRLPPNVAAAYERMFLLPSAPDEVVKAAFRALVKLHHPDTGGDLEVCKRLNIAFDDISQYWRRRDQAQAQAQQQQRQQRPA